MGYARGAFTCLISSTTTQRPGNLYSVVSTCKPRQRKKRGIAKKLILTIRAIMIGQQIDVVAGDFNGTATGTTSVLSTKPLQTAHCQRRRAPHRGDPDQL